LPNGRLKKRSRILEPHQKGSVLAEFAEAAEGRRRLFPFLPENAPDTAFQCKEWVDIPEE